MNEMLAQLARLLGQVRSIRTLGPGTQTEHMSAGFYELRSLNGWSYYREGDKTIVLDSSALPVDSTDALTISPDRAEYLYLERHERWSFLVEAGAMLQIILREVE